MATTRRTSLLIDEALRDGDGQPRHVVLIPNHLSRRICDRRQPSRRVIARAYYAGDGPHDLCLLDLPPVNVVFPRRRA